jgi:septal ring factor EnvC (AmiA/AmiB activator)
MRVRTPLLLNKNLNPASLSRLILGRSIAAAIVCTLTFFFVAAHAEPLAAKESNKNTAKRLGEVERQLKQKREQKSQLDNKAKKITVDLARLNQEIVSAAKSIHHYESEASRLEIRLRQLLRNEAKSLSRLKTVRKQTAQVLMALGRMARNPPEALMVQPTTPSETVRSAILLRATVPEIERRAHRLRVRLDELTAAQEAVSLRRYRLKDVMKSLRSQQTLLSALMVQKEKIRKETTSSSVNLAKHVANLAREASSLRDLMDALRRHSKKRRQQQGRPKEGAKDKTKKAGKNRRPPNKKIALRKLLKPNGRPITKSRGLLIYPAVGRIVGRYGRSSRAGLGRKGLSIEARPGGQVVAPFRGEVVFADRFRGYGRLLIIDHSEGYHTLLAGFSRIYVKVGQSIVAGEPVGVMERPKNKYPVLYIEFRRKGHAINPLPWLTTQRAKVKK